MIKISPCAGTLIYLSRIVFFNFLMFDLVIMFCRDTGEKKILFYPGKHHVSSTGYFSSIVSIIYCQVSVLIIFPCSLRS